MNTKNNVLNVLKKYNDIEYINFNKLDIELKNIYGLTYQSIKQIINEFYNENIYQELCYKYAKEFRCVEFNHLIKSYERGLNKCIK
jgi:DNA-binding XRE family transcriptional regulator